MCSEDVGGGPLCGEPASFDGAAYDPITDTWRVIAAGPVPAGGAPTQNIPQAVWSGSEMVIWGGWGEPIAAAYNPETDTWRELSAGPLQARDQAAMLSWADGIAVIGGSTPSGPGPQEWFFDAALLDPRSGDWRLLPDLPRPDPATYASPVVATEAPDGRLFVVMSALSTEQGVTLDTFALERDGTEWRHLGSSHFEQYLQPVAVASGQWLFVGGQFEGPSAAAVLDLGTGAWATTTPPPIEAEFLSVSTGDRVLAVPARWSQDPAPPMTLSWDPATQMWLELAPPPLEHRIGAAVAWTGEELLIWGGGSSGGFGGPSFADGARFHP